MQIIDIGDTYEETLFNCRSYHSFIPFAICRSEPYYADGSVGFQIGTNGNILN